MHYTAVEEAPVGEVVTVGMFLVNKHPAIVLFDLGASHSFMSQSFASRHDQKVIEVSKGGYSISLAGATISTNKIVRDVLIFISREGVHDGSDSIARIIYRCDLRYEMDERSWSSQTLALIQLC